MDEQIQVVLAVLKGELSLAEAARRPGVPSATVGNGGTGSSTPRAAYLAVEHCDYRVAFGGPAT